VRRRSVNKMQIPVVQESAESGSGTFLRECFDDQLASGHRGFLRFCEPRTEQKGARPGAVLLEVVLSFGLLVFGMAMVGLQVRAGLDAARATDMGTRALLLMDTLLAELDSGAILVDTTDEETEGDFGIKAPGFTWRIEVEQTDVENLYMLTLELGFNPGHVEAQRDDPDYEIDFEDEGTSIMRTVYRLYPMPADINMERDYGVTSEDMEKLLGMGSSAESGGDESTGGGARVEGGGGGGGGGGAAPAAFGEGDLASLAAEMGVDLSALDFLFDPAGFDPRMLSQMPEEQFAQLMELLETFMPGGAAALSGAQGPSGPPIKARGMGGKPSDPQSPSEERASRRDKRRHKREESSNTREEERRARREARRDRSKRNRDEVDDGEDAPELLPDGRDPRFPDEPGVQESQRRRRRR